MDAAAGAARPDIEGRLLDIIAREGMVDRDALVSDATLESLGVQSSDVIVILMSIEESFGVYIPIDTEMSDVRTVGELIDALSAHIAGEQSN